MEPWELLERMKIRLEVEYHQEYVGEFEPYIARILDYPELMGYGNSPEEAINNALAFLEEHLGKSFKIVGEEVQLELAS